MNNIVYKFVKLLHGYTGKFVYLKEKEELDSRDEKWRANFSNTDKFTFSISDNIKIFLHQSSILSKLIYDGFEKDEINFLKSTLQEGDIFIDIGANIGLFSLHAASLIGNEGKVIAFEPSPDTYQKLKENVALNNFKNIECIHKGISNKRDNLEISISETGYDAWNTFAPGDSDKFNKKVMVEVNTLDAELASIEKDRIKIVKVDVEGWEKFVILGAEDLLTNYSPIVMMEFTEANTFAAGYFVQELYDMLLTFGYQWYRIKDSNLILEKKKLHYPYDNLIAIKKKG